MIVLGDGTFEKWLGHEGETPMDGITALIKKAWGRSLALSAMWGHKERSATQQRALTRPRWHPGLGLSASRSVRNEFLLLISYPFCTVLYSSPNRQRQLSRETYWNAKRTNASCFPSPCAFFYLLTSHDLVK